VDDIGGGQLGYYLSRNLNVFLAKHYDTDVTVFYDTMHRQCMMPNFPVMQMAEAWGQHGPAVATSISTAIKLLDFPGPSPKLFYVWDLQWIRRGQQMWEIFEYVYCNPRLTLIARGEDHQRVISQCFNRDVEYIVDDFNIEQLLGVIDQC
jgi:hypothetical protein